MKMIILDLDFTLLRSNQTVSGYSIKILKQCRKNGHMIAFGDDFSDYNQTNQNTPRQDIPHHTIYNPTERGCHQCHQTGYKIYQKPSTT